MNIIQIISEKIPEVFNSKHSYSSYDTDYSMIAGKFALAFVVTELTDDFRVLITIGALPFLSKVLKRT